MKWHPIEKCTAACFNTTQEIHCEAVKRKSKLISIRLPIAMYQALRDYCEQHSEVSYQRLIKRFIREGLTAKRRGTSGRLRQK